MARRPSLSVVRPRPASDRPVAWKLGAVAVAGLALGLGIARWAWTETTVHRRETSRVLGAGPRETGTEAPHRDLSPRAPRQVPGPGHAARPAPTGPPSAVFHAHATPLAHASGAIPPPPALAVPEPHVAFERVRVAYLHCTGLPPAAGPFPCSRDRDLEKAAWTILSDLPACPDAPKHPGEADVHLEMRSGGAPVVHVSSRGAGNPGRLDPERVGACVEAPLGALRTTLGATDLLLSFRFRLVAVP